MAMNKRHRDILASWQPAVDFALARRVDSVRPEGSGFKISALSSNVTELMIYGDIGGSMWDGGVSAQNMASMLDNVTTPYLDVRINSRGGDAFDGVAIHTMLARHSAVVTTYNDGVAASAASVIMMAGDRIVSARNALTMIHDAMTGTYGGPATHGRAMELLEKVSDNIADMYAMRTGEGDSASWRAVMSQNGEDGMWYTGAEAVDVGLADEIAGEVTDPAVADRVGRLLAARYPNAPRLAMQDASSMMYDASEEIKEEQQEEFNIERVSEQGFALLAAFNFGR